MKNITMAVLATTAATLAFAESVPKISAMSPDNAISSSQTIDERKQILDLVRLYTRSVNEGDIHPELIDELWEHSPDVSNINIRGHQKGFEEIKNNFYAPLFTALKNRNLRMVSDVREPSIYFFDNTAVVEFYWKINVTIKDGNKDVDMSGRETHIYRKNGAQWKLVHLHYSGMPVQGF